MKNIIIIIFATAICCNMNGQQLVGTIFGGNQDGSRTALPAASVYWEGMSQGATADADGKFVIDFPSSGNARLIVSFVGYQNDTITVPAGTNQIEVVLIEGVVLGEAVVTARRRGTYFSRMTALQTEIITCSGLQKLACCNLGESFENSATVTVGFTDAVSGARQVQMLGLSGIYTQMLDENIPTLHGLSSTFGWNFVPGPWLESIQISKGTSSVVTGYESTTGQINLEFKKPNKSELVFLNLFASNEGRLEANVTSAIPVTERLWTGLLLHGSTEQREHDHNNDGFMDMPKSNLVNVYNRWIYVNPEKGLESRFGIKFLNDERDGGQISKIGDYQTRIENRNFTATHKTGFAFGARHGQSIGFINSFTHHELNSTYGLKTYGGKQNTFYNNILVSSNFGNPAHSYTAGGSFLYDRFDEWYGDELPSIDPLSSLVREEIVPGAFFQYTWTASERMTLIVGMRGDYHNRFGMLYTPRANIKYNLTPHIVFRTSAGRGYRSPNVISENIGFLASSRHYNIGGISDLKIEKAWNYGANLSFYLPMPNSETLTISMDYYRTDFENQAIIDMEYDQRQVFFYNLNGKSYANAWQIDASTTFFRGFDIFAAFRWNDTKITYSREDRNITVHKPLTSKYRGLLNLSYATNFEKWKFDVTAQFNGNSRLPNLSDGGYLDVEEWSPAYPLYFAQATKKFKRLDIYAGCENILNFKQKDPILNYDDPFGTNFDASRIWGPLMGRKFYIGIRLRLGEII